LVGEAEETGNLLRRRGFLAANPDLISSVSHLQEIYGNDMENLISDREKLVTQHRKNWKLFLGLFLLLGILPPLVIWGQHATENLPPSPSAPAKDQAKAPAKMKTLILTDIQDGDKHWVLEADKADFFDSQSEIVITGVKRLEFPGPQGEPIKVKCREGVINTKTRLLTLKGQVELDSKDMKVKTELAFYQPGDRTVLAPGEVTMKGPRVKVQGKGLRVWLADQHLVLSHHYLTELKVEKRQPHPLNTTQPGNP
jgi:LPS export ABC transporter protein LptC